MIVEGLERIGDARPEALSDVIDTLARQLAKHVAQSREFNSELMLSLAVLGAIEHEALILEAFDAGHVDARITGERVELLTTLHGGDVPGFDLPVDRAPLPLDRMYDDIARAKKKAKTQARAHRKAEKQAKRKARRK